MGQGVNMGMVCGVQNALEGQITRVAYRRSQAWKLVHCDDSVLTNQPGNDFAGTSHLAGTCPHWDTRSEALYARATETYQPPTFARRDRRGHQSADHQAVATHSDAGGYEKMWYIDTAPPPQSEPWPGQP